MRTTKTIVEIIAITFIALWLYAGLSKLVDYNTFKLQLGQSPYLENMAGFVAWSIPVSELAIVLLLAVSKTRLLGLYASFFLITLFTGYIYVIMNFSYYVPCSCGGILEKMDWGDHFVFNLLFFLLSLIGILAYRQQNVLQLKTGKI